MQSFPFDSVYPVNTSPSAPPSTELTSLSARSQAWRYLCGDGRGELRVVIDPSVLAVLDDGAVLWLQRGVEQQLKLGLREHLAGPEGAVGIPGDADEQNFLCGEVLKCLLRWNCTVVRRGGSEKVVQQKVHGKVNSWEAEDKQNQNLESAKAADFQEEILKFHLFHGGFSFSYVPRSGNMSLESGLCPWSSTSHGFHTASSLDFETLLKGWQKSQ